MVVSRKAAHAADWVDFRVRARAAAYYTDSSGGESPSATLGAAGDGGGVAVPAPTGTVLAAMSTGLPAEVPGGSRALQSPIPGQGSNKWMAKLRRGDYSGPETPLSQYLCLRGEVLESNPRSSEEYKDLCCLKVGLGPEPDRKRYEPFSA